MKYKYKIIGYQEEDKIARRLDNVVILWVIAENSGEALDKAKKMVKKKHYRVQKVHGHEIAKNSPLEEYNIQNLLQQKYRKSVDTKMLKNSKELNNILENILTELAFPKLRMKNQNREA